MNGPQIRWLPDARRLHLHHGPIDLIVEAWGEGERLAAYRQAAARFATILEELVAELPLLRRPVRPGAAPIPLSGPAARRMHAAVLPFAAQFITPMAAVAGSVADEVLAAMLAGGDLRRAYANNGGDIALHLAEGEALTLAVAGVGSGSSDKRLLPDDGLTRRLTIRAGEPVRGVATSGWRGRSFSLGIADAVTVLARTGAAADAAATVVANAVDLPGHSAILRRPACELQPDSDLGGLRVTIGVGTLTPAEIAIALDRGLAAADDLLRRGLIEGAALFLAGECRICGLAGPPWLKPSRSASCRPLSWAGDPAVLQHCR